jgi:hypothetical protein
MSRPPVIPDRVAMAMAAPQNGLHRQGRDRHERERGCMEREGSLLLAFANLPANAAATVVQGNCDFFTFKKEDIS